MIQLLSKPSRSVGCGLVVAGCWLLAALQADDKKPSYPKPPSAANVKVMPDNWRLKVSRPLNAAELDQLCLAELNGDKRRPAPLTTDEQFLRRVHLDLVGKLPLPADVDEFVKSRDVKKRSKLIDKLLASDDFCNHWARYWCDVVVARATDMRTKRQAGAFEEWLGEQLKAKRNWGQIARDIIAAEGVLRMDEGGKNGAAYFLLAHSGAEAANERAAETSRVFLGIQIQCAQCHDHPSDMWKRTQFHELAAFFARTRERQIREENRVVGIQIGSLPRGEHAMPDLENPKKSTAIHPRFLTGESIPRGQDDVERRKALAALITSPENYWFAAAYVNRVWGELMGQAFYQPVDHMGPLQEATFPDVLERLAASFALSDYDIRELFRTVMNTQTYQRQIRLGDSANDHLLFSASYPTRLRADALWESLVGVLGFVDNASRANVGRPKGPPVPNRGLQGMFEDTFSFDPSLKSDDVEGSVLQALLLMNNQVINDRIKATGNNVLARILKAYPQDDEAIKMVYLRTLARKPTAREIETCRKYVKQVGNRAEAFEDIFWSLINSTEFQTRR